MYSQFAHIKFLIQPTNRKGWVRVVSIGGEHVADFVSRSAAAAWCESQA